MKMMRTAAFALLGVFAVAAIAPVHAQTSAKKQAKKERKAVKREMKAEARMERMDNMNMSPMPGNNTAVVQSNIDRANKTLSDMVALLDQIEARKKGGAQ